MGNFFSPKRKSKIAPAVLSGTTHAQQPTISGRARGPRTLPATSSGAGDRAGSSTSRTGGEQQRDVATTSRVITIPQARLVVVKPAEESESQRATQSESMTLTSFHTIIHYGNYTQLIIFFSTTQLRHIYNSVSQLLWLWRRLNFFLHDLL